MKLCLVGAVLAVALVVLVSADSYGSGGYGFGTGGVSYIPYYPATTGTGGIWGDSWILGFIGLLFVLTILFSNESQDNATSRIISVGR